MICPCTWPPPSAPPSDATPRHGPAGACAAMPATLATACDLCGCVARCPFPCARSRSALLVSSWRTRRGTTRADVRRARPACHPRATPGSWHLIGNLSPWRSRVSRCTCLASIHAFKLPTPRRLERVFPGTARLPSECHPQKSAPQPSAACLLIQYQRSDATKCLHRRARPWRQAFACSGAARAAPCSLPHIHPSQGGACCASATLRQMGRRELFPTPNFAKHYRGCASELFAVFPVG